MKYLSLGQGCQVAMYIRSLLGSEPTGIFDTVVTNFRSVLDILKTGGFTRSDFTDQRVFYDPAYHWRGENVSSYTSSWIPDKTLIEHKKHLFISPHYIKLGEYVAELDNFVSMMNRRLTRFINTIKTHDNVHFIHCVNAQFTQVYIPTKTDIDDFNNYTKTLNKNIKYKLSIVVHPEHKSIFDEQYEHTAHADAYYLEYTTLNTPLRMDWMDSNLNWKDFFKQIA